MTDSDKVALRRGAAGHERTAAAIEARQRTAAAQPVARGPYTLASLGIRPNPQFALNQRLARDVIEARAALDLAVVTEDWRGVIRAYFTWTDSQYRSTRLGGDAYNDIPMLSTIIDQAAQRAASARRADVDAAIEAEKEGDR